MSRTHRHTLSIVVGLLLLTGLALATGQAGWPPRVDLTAWLLFTSLFVFANTFGFPLGGGQVNLVPLATVGGLLVMGPLAATWMALIGSLLHALVRAAYARRLGTTPPAGGWLGVLGVGLANAVILSVSLLGGAVVYRLAAGPIPLLSLNPQALGAYLPLMVAFPAINYLLVAGYLRLSGNAAAMHAYRLALPRVAVYEVVPLAFTPLLSLIYNRLGPGPFVLFAVALGGASLIARSLSNTGQRLEQRLTELKTLGALSQALAASLQMDSLLGALHEQLPFVMPASNFYVALHPSDTGDVSFPLVIQDGQLRQWPSRPAGNGLADYVMRTRQPLLIPHAVPDRLRALGLEEAGPPANSWLGVPIIAGSQVMGVLAAQSFDPHAFTAAQRDLLSTIATQLAMALKNAWLYEQTDQALAQRLQQLSSILDTARDGILLLDLDARVLTANRAVASFIHVPVTELAQRELLADSDLLIRLGINQAEFHQDLATLLNGTDLVKRAHTVSGPPPRDVERTLAAVRDVSGAAAGWLMVLRDVTEERALGRLRDDLTHMLIHDLRSPLGSILTSLALIQQIASPGQPLEPDALEILQLAHSSGQNLLRLINQLLEIARLESGALPLERQWVQPGMLLSAAAERLQPAADKAAIRLLVEVGPNLPGVLIDLELMRRVLDNLGDNAIKFSPDGSQVLLWTRPGPAQDTVQLGVTDNGPGIPIGAQAHLFEKFNRVPNINSRREGTGLGLAFCRLVVEAHRGRISVTSQPGCGATFAFSLPANGAEADAIP